MEQSKKNFKKEDDEALILKKIGQTIHTSFGHLIRTVRLASPLSHDEMQMNSSLNSATIWRLEHLSNFSILKFIEASYYYFKSVKCDFYIHHLRQQLENCIHDGKCLVAIEVDSSDLDKYSPSQVILSQKSDDIEELARRDSFTQKKLHNAGKKGKKKKAEKSTKSTKTKKKKIKK